MRYHIPDTAVQCDTTYPTHSGIPHTRHIVRSDTRLCQCAVIGIDLVTRNVTCLCAYATSLVCVHMPRHWCVYICAYTTCAHTHTSAHTCAHTRHVRIHESGSRHTDKHCAALSMGSNSLRSNSFRPVSPSPLQHQPCLDLSS